MKLCADMVDKVVLPTVLMCLVFAINTNAQIENCSGLLSGCGKTKSCFSNPPDCCEDCTIVATWSSNNNNVTFELVGKSSGWVAVGFSDKKEMEGGEALACFEPDMLKHYNMGHHSVSLSALTTGFNFLSSSSVNGYVRCKFSRMKNPGNGMKDLNQPWYLLFGVGPVQSGSIRKHTTRFMTPEKEDVSKIQTVGTEEAVHPLIKAHGCLMCIAWLGPAILGFFFARYMKSAFGDETLLGLKVWFQCHRGLMLFAVLFTAVGAILIFQKEHWEMEDDLHPVIGLVVIILSFLQPVVALFRPPPNHERRWLFNWGHRIFGITTLILAMVAIFLGINMDDVALGARGNVTIGLYLGCVCIIALCLEVFDYLEKKPSVEVTAISDVVAGAKGENVYFQDIARENKFQTRRKLVLGVLSVLSTIAVILSVIFIASAKHGAEGDDSDAED